jgi:DNA invertase Pin-like site-specific DNA recombinase
MRDGMVRVAIYTRVSTEDQAKEGFSLDAQKERLHSYCKARGWTIIKEYIDEGHSGRNIRRPAYQQMLKEKDEWDTILVIKMDRIHRNSRNFMEMMDNLRKWEKEFTSMQESLDTSTAMGRFVVDIIQRIAQLESEQIGERVYMGMRQKASTVGGILGFNIPYGYDYIDEELVLNKEEASVVTLIFNEYLNGASIGDIVKELNDKNITTKHKKRWARQTVANIIKNPLYCGYTRWEEIVRKGKHIPIVDVPEFNKVQQRIVKQIRRPQQRPKSIFQVEEQK